MEISVRRHKYLIRGCNAKIIESNPYFNDFITSTIVPKSITYRNKEYFITSIGDHAFMSENLGVLEFPDDTKIESFTEKCLLRAKIEKLIIPSTLRYISPSAMIEARIKSIEVKKGNSHFVFCDDGALYSISPLIAIKSVIRTKSFYMFRESTTTFSFSFFENNKYIKRVSLPRSLVSIPDNAFDQSSLERISIPDNVVEIGKYAFNCCKCLKWVSIGENSKLKRLSESCFYECISLKKIFIPEGIEMIPSYSFMKCSFLHDVRFSKNSQLILITKAAFYNCNNLIELRLPPTIKLIKADMSNTIKRVFCPNHEAIIEDCSIPEDSEIIFT